MPSATMKYPNAKVAPCDACNVFFDSGLSQDDMTEIDDSWDWIEECW